MFYLGLLILIGLVLFVLKGMYDTVKRDLWGSLFAMFGYAIVFAGLLQLGMYLFQS